MCTSHRSRKVQAKKSAFGRCNQRCYGRYSSQKFAYTYPQPQKHTLTHPIPSTQPTISPLLLHPARIYVAYCFCQTHPSCAHYAARGDAHSSPAAALQKRSSHRVIPKSEFLTFDHPVPYSTSKTLRQRATSSSQC